MTQLVHVINKYHGKKICDMSAPELELFLSTVAEQGALNILKKIGLDDDSAGTDIRDIRDLLKGYRVVKSEAWKRTWQVFWAIITVYIISRVVDSSHAKQILAILGG